MWGHTFGTSAIVRRRSRRYDDSQPRAAWIGSRMTCPVIAIQGGVPPKSSVGHVPHTPKRTQTSPAATISALKSQPASANAGNAADALTAPIRRIGSKRSANSSTRIRRPRVPRAKSRISSVMSKIDSLPRNKRLTPIHCDAIAWFATVGFLTQRLYIARQTRAALTNA